MRYLSAIVPCDSTDSAVCSYLSELSKIAGAIQSLTKATVDKLKKARILLGSRFVRSQESDQPAIHIEGDEEGGNEDQKLEYNLLPPGQVAVADDPIALQQFGEDIFCAPQDDTLEGVCDKTCALHSMLILEITAFYQSLGCKKLSDLVREGCKTTQETYGNKRAQKVRSLILERLPLFLSKHAQQAKVTPRVSTMWLNKDGNLTTKTFKKITITKSINFAGAKSSKSFEVSATTRREGVGPIQLWLSDSGEVDMHEVAASLCRLVLCAHKIGDACMFQMLLSTDLRTLKSWGYPGNHNIFFPF